MNNSNPYNVAIDYNSAYEYGGSSNLDSGAIVNVNQDSNAIVGSNTFNQSIS